MARNPIERALGVWSGTNYRSVMLPGLGVVTCGELCDAIAALKAENQRLKKALSEQIDRDISGIFPGERALAERAGGGGRQDAIDFLYKHGALTHVAARDAVELLTSNGFEISRRSK